MALAALRVSERVEKRLFGALCARSEDKVRLSGDLDANVRAC